MDNQSKQTGLGVQKTDRLGIVALYLGFLFLFVGPFIMVFVDSRPFGIPLVAIGFIGIIYGSIKIKLNNTNQFIVGFFGWFIFSFLINIFVLSFFKNPYFSEIQVIAVMATIQLFGYSLAFLTFRKNKRWIGIGIILASAPYFIGFIVHGGCAPIGIPFPISIILPC